MYVTEYSSEYKLRIDTGQVIPMECCPKGLANLSGNPFPGLKGRFCQPRSETAQPLQAWGAAANKNPALSGRFKPMNRPDRPDSEGDRGSQASDGCAVSDLG